MRQPDVPPGRPLRVLLVEDSENDEMLLLRELRRGATIPASSGSTRQRGWSGRSRTRRGGARRSRWLSPTTRIPAVTYVQDATGSNAVPYGGRDVMCIVSHDVTGRKRAEQVLEEIREAERNRIARELHDGTLQDIVYALQEIQIVQAVSEDGGESALEEAAEALRRSAEGRRGAIFELCLKETLGRSFVSSLENLRWRTCWT